MVRRILLLIAALAAVPAHANDSTAEALAGGLVLTRTDRVDKGAADNLVSLCGDAIRKISPTQFEMVKTNWRPERDLKVLIVDPALKNAG